MKTSGLIGLKLKKIAHVLLIALLCCCAVAFTVALIVCLASNQTPITLIISLSSCAGVAVFAFVVYLILYSVGDMCEISAPQPQTTEIEIAKPAAKKKRKSLKMNLSALLQLLVTLTAGVLTVLSVIFFFNYTRGGLPVLGIPMTVMIIAFAVATVCVAVCCIFQKYRIGATLGIVAFLAELVFNSMFKMTGPNSAVFGVGSPSAICLLELIAIILAVVAGLIAIANIWLCRKFPKIKYILGGATLALMIVSAFLFLRGGTYPAFAVNYPMDITFYGVRNLGRALLDGVIFTALSLSPAYSQIVLQKKQKAE